MITLDYKCRDLVITTANVINTLATTMTDFYMNSNSKKVKANEVSRDNVRNAQIQYFAEFFRTYITSGYITLAVAEESNPADIKLARLSDLSFEATDELLDEILSQIVEIDGMTALEKKNQYKYAIIVSNDEAVNSTFMDINYNFDNLAKLPPITKCTKDIKFMYKDVYNEIQASLYQTDRESAKIVSTHVMNHVHNISIMLDLLSAMYMKFLMDASGITSFKNNAENKKFIEEHFMEYDLWISTVISMMTNNSKLYDLYKLHNPEAVNASLKGEAVEIKLGQINSFRLGHKSEIVNTSTLDKNINVNKMSLLLIGNSNYFYDVTLTGFDLVE